jgi:rSAM/selenodomain-associated transferase 2
VTRVSIVIPVLNEAQALRHNLPLLQRFRAMGHELIVVDGGSSDASVEVASPLADRVISSEPGRARQMNRGASVASGDILMFLHIDTLLPERAIDAVLAIDAKPYRWGRFDVRLSGTAAPFRVIEFMMNLRSRISGVATGDQVIFIRTDEFAAVDGYPDLPLMEDIALTKQLRNRSSGLCLRERVVTSSRRWEANGIVKTVLLMWWIRLLYVLGITPQTLHDLYLRKRS